MRNLKRALSGLLLAALVPACLAEDGIVPSELDVGPELELGLGSRLLSRLGTKLELGSGFLSGRMAQTALCRLSSRRTPSHCTAPWLEWQPSQRRQL